MNKDYIVLAWVYWDEGARKRIFDNLERRVDQNYPHGHISARVTPARSNPAPV